MAALALIALLLVIASRDEAAAPVTRPAPPAEAAGRELPQADWVVESYPAGFKRKPNRAVKRRVNWAAAAIASNLDELYSTAFLEPDGFGRTTRTHMVSHAARRFRNAGITVVGANDVQFKRRRAWIGVEGRNARSAVATVLLNVTGRLDDEERFRVQHHATLWLQRSKGSWKVIGFDITQGPRR